MARISRKEGAAAVSPISALHVYKTALYIRLSDEDIRKKISDSIGTQKTMLLHFLESQPDLQLSGTYEDVNYTGTNFNRPGFTQMLEDIGTGLVDCVVVKDLSRFGRSSLEMGNYLERVFPFLGVRFISVNDGYDSLTASLDDSSLIVPLKNLMNEVYARDISRKVRSSIKLKQKRGEFVGSVAPYGYIKNGTAFTLDEEAAAVVRQIFGWIIDGHSDIAVAQKLNDLNIIPPSRYRFEKGITKAKKHEETRFWYKSAVKRISENPAYTGVLAQAKYQSNFLRGGGRTTNDRDAWIVTEDAHPSIIDAETFETVRKIREARKQNVKAREDYVPYDNIFKGLMVCGDCKAHMMREKVRRASGIIKFFYVCNVYAQVDRNACTMKKIAEDKLRAALFAYISREISLAVDMGRIITDLQKRDAYKGQRSMTLKQIDALQKKLSANMRFRGSLREDYKDGVLSEQDYALMKADYDEEKDRLGGELDVLFAEKSRQENLLSPENKWTREFRRFETEHCLSAGMVSSLVERIEVYAGERIDVTLRYRDEFEALREHLSHLWDPRETCFAGRGGATERASFSPGGGKEQSEVRDDEEARAANE
ncbi:MAG: recombinase family protein [Oscillospiraceae bacterium]|jgi:DNA invertase Pin-like site-specific DNA recombinase|nr:recombinase family protein [Oscillospiraceae bacterium]